KIQTGTCDFACKMATYPMRAMGIPVSFDYTLDWANRNQRHNWNAVIFDGKQKTFNGGESSVGSHKVQYIGVGRIKCKPAKVFRKTYSIQANSLPLLADKKEEIPGVFNNKRSKDVTSQYTPVSDVHIPKKHNNKTGYLCTFNNSNWVLSFWGKVENNEYVFKDMGRGIAYLSALYKKGNIIPQGDPFILKNDGEISVCKADYEKKQTIKILSKYPEDESNNISPGDIYELYFWDEGWVSAGAKLADTTYLTYESMPSNALFWIRNHSGGIQERIFTYEENKQIWW
ncbi:MAG TPA: hypothetical protein VHO50_10450, partial [Bacteroidales bacterium]|nr:hypothetical protein [Bacteroidales bacterium]